MHMKAERHIDDGSTVWSFTDHFLVECPRCGKCAKTSPVHNDAETTARMVCTFCGHTKTRGKLYAARKLQGGDWYFDIPLWLQTACCGEILWAHNLQHLAYLESYVSATHRDRKPDYGDGPRNETMASRLPGWMTNAKNRTEVLRCIQRLRDKTVG